MNEHKLSNGRTVRMWRKPEEFTALDEAVSTTGKYSIAFGQHFKPEICYDILSHNNETGEVVRRHYPGSLAAASLQLERARACWEKFKEDMTAPRGPSEEDEQDELRIISPN